MGQTKSILCLCIPLTIALASNADAGWSPFLQGAEAYDVGGTPAGVTSGDFDSDGRPDVAVLHDGSSNPSLYNAVRVFCHETDPAYPPLFDRCSVTYVGGQVPAPSFQIASGDVNGDGKLDIVSCQYGTSNGQNAVSVLFNSYKPFGPAAVSKIVPYMFTGRLSVGDVNNDGRADVVCPADGPIAPGVVVLLGVPGDSLGPPSYYPPLASPLFSVQRAHIADVTGDGAPDILVVADASNGHVYYFPGNNTGTFGQPIGPLSVSAANIHDVLVEQLDNDGLPDLVVFGTGLNSLRVHYGTGPAQWASPIGLPTNHVSSQVIAGDVEGDGDLDILSFDSSYTPFSAVALLRNHGSGFDAVENFDALPYVNGAALFDANLDNKLDIAVSGNAIDSHSLRVLRNDGAGGFRDAIESGLTNSQAFYDQAIGNFDGDGKPDIAIAAGGSVVIAAGDGAGRFSEIRQIAVGTTWPIAGGDIDGAGASDVAVQSGSSITVIRNGATLGTSFTGKLFRKSLGDINLDGRTDIVGTNGSTSLVVFRQQADGTYISTTSKTLAGPVYNLCIGDWNRDGRPDVATVGDLGLSIYPGSTVTLGNLDNALTVMTGRVYQHVCAADFNRDGALDIAARQSGVPNIDLFLGLGNMSFGPPVSIATLEAYGTDLDAADMNRDGILDLITTATEGSSYKGAAITDVFLGNGGGLFAFRTSYTTGMAALQLQTFLSIGDINRDGTADIAGPAYTGNQSFIELFDFYAMLSTPPPVSTTMNAMTAYPTLSAPTSVALGDVNRDGKLDAVASAVGSSPGVAVMLGDGRGGLGASTTLAQSFFARHVDLADLNRDGKLDIVATNNVAEVPVRVSTMLGAGDGTFGFRNDLPIPAGFDFEIGDMNRDAIPDVVTTLQDSVRVLTGTGTGTLTPGSAIATGVCRDLDLADLNEDGFPDLVMACGAVKVSLAGAGGVINAPTTLSAPLTSCDDVCVADFNRDGKLDILASQGNDYYVIWGPSFSTHTTTTLAFSAADMKVGGFESDGRPLLFVSRGVGALQVVSVALSGQLTSIGTYQAANTPDALALGDMDRNGAIDAVTADASGASVVVTLQSPNTVTAVEPAPGTPERARLAQNYPNPFNPRTTITFTLTARERARLAIYDVQGRLVARLANRTFEAGSHQISWDGVDTNGRKVGSGVYLYRLTTDSGASSSKRMVLVK